MFYLYLRESDGEKVIDKIEMIVKLINGVVSRGY